MLAWYVFLHSLTFSIFILKCISLNIQQGSNKADEILLNVMWQPGWEGSLGENEYMRMYGRVPLLFTWNYHNINWLYPNKKKVFKKWISYRQYRVGSYFLIHSDSLLIGVFRTLTFKVIIDGLISIIFAIVFHLLSLILLFLSFIIFLHFLDSVQHFT